MARSGKHKTPKLSFEATHALNQASEPFFGIEVAINRLEEQDLSALATEARRKASEDHPELYLAVAAIADAELTKLATRRSADGVWYACLDVIRWEPSQRIGQGIASYSEKCDGRNAAVLVARRLLVEHAEKITDDTTVEARIVTELEWLADQRV